MLDIKLYIGGTQPSSPRIWTFDGTTWEQWVDFAAIDANFKEMRDMCYFSVDKNLYVIGKLHGGIYSDDGVIWRFDGSSWSNSLNLIGGGDCATGYALCELGGYLYAMFECGDFIRVFKQDPVDTWTLVFDSNPYGHYGSYEPGSLRVVTDGTNEYMITWMQKDERTDPEFFLTKDGTTWYNSTYWGWRNYNKLSYVIWDPVANYWRFSTRTCNIDMSTPSMEDGAFSWSNRADHLHPNGAYNAEHNACCNYFTLSNGDVLMVSGIVSATSPYANQIRRLDVSAGAWANEQEVATGTEYVGRFTNRHPSWGLEKWKEKIWVILPIVHDANNIGRIWSYDEGSGVWTQESTCGDATDLYLVSLVVGEQEPPAPPAPVGKKNKNMRLSPVVKYYR